MWITSELCGVIGCPVEERVCGCSCDLCDCGRNVRRLANGGCPGLKQHIHGRQRPDREQLTPRLLWRDLSDAQRTADHPPSAESSVLLAEGHFFPTIAAQSFSVIRCDCDLVKSSNPLLAHANSSMFQCARMIPHDECELLPSNEWPISWAATCPRMIAGSTNVSWLSLSIPS